MGLKNQLNLGLFLLGFFPAHSQSKSLISEVDLAFLQGMAKDVTEASRIYPGQKISKDFGPNQTGGVLIRPGGRSSYPAFWIRDYAMSLEAGFVKASEQKHMLLLTAKTQAVQTMQTKWGTHIPKGAIADHIRIDDSEPIYFPGSYDAFNQGKPVWGMQPPFCDAYFFIHMAYYYAVHEKQRKVLKENMLGLRLIDRMEMAFESVPQAENSPLVSVTDANRGVDFGFRDAVYMTGDLCYSSLLKYQAARQLAEMQRDLGDLKKFQHYTRIALALKKAITDRFQLDSGFLKASTGTSGQADVWATSLAYRQGILPMATVLKASKKLNDGYEKGDLSYRGNIRHILRSDDFSAETAWEKSEAKKDSYQNGAYWGTPVAWVANLMAETRVDLAKKLIQEYIHELREGDFRKGEGFGAPWECFSPQSAQNPVYMTSVTCPFIALKP
jgi:hypothetical protein